MSLVDSSIDCVHQRIKRKLDDYGPTDDEDFSSDLVSVRMKKDQPDAVNSSTNQITPQQQQQPHIEPRVSDARSASCSSSTHPSLSRSLSSLQFFVRMISRGNTLVLHANSHDTVKSIHERIQSITGIPLIEQRLIYCGKQLQLDQSLADCCIQNDAGLQLVGRMRSTEHPQAWQVIDEMVSLVFRMCKGEQVPLKKCVKSMLTEFLTMTPINDTEQAAGHLQIFKSSCAPAALVMLYMSAIEGNKKCADESIRQFINSSRNVLPKPIHSQCAPIVLEFCKLLGRGASHEDPLYILCRNSLGSIVENIGMGRGLRNSDGNKALIAVQEIFPFVSELAAKLSHDLDSSMQSITSAGPSLSDVRDFTAFLLPLRTTIVEQVGYGRPIAMPFCEGAYNVTCYCEEIKFLHTIFINLLEKMEQCLQRMEELMAVKQKGDDENLYLGWAEYLSILKELNNISKLYQGAEEEFWTKLRHRKVSVCYLIIKYAKRTDDHRWIIEHKEVTNFESRRHLAMMMLPEVKDEYEELHEMLLDRSQLLAESFEYIAHADPEALRGGLFLEFKNEEATGPGVLREWFFLVCQAIFNPQNALFVACPNDRRRFFPNPGKNFQAFFF